MTAVPGLDRVDHVAIAVRSADAASKHFTTVLGLAVVGDEIADAPGVRLVYLDAGNTFVQLVEPVREGPVSAWLDEHGDGLHHICFAVDDIPSTLSAIPGESEARIFAGGRGRRACFLTTEEFNVKVELTENEPGR